MTTSYTMALQIGLQAQFKADKAPPIMLIGPSGIGKTEISGALVQKMGKTMAEYSLAQTCAELIGGFPYADTEKGVTHLLPSAEILRICEAGEASGVVLLDEICDAREDVQAAAHAVLTHGKFGNLQTPRFTAFVAAGNPPDISTTGGCLSIPMAKRICQVPFPANVNAFVDGLRSGFPAPEVFLLPDGWENGIPHWGNLIGSFIHAKPAWIESIPDANATLGGMVLGKSAPSPCPRTWHYAVVLLAACDGMQAAHPEMKALIREARYLLLAGVVGETAASEYLSYERNLDLPNPEDILSDPFARVDSKGVETLPKRGDQIRTAAHAVVIAALSNNTPERWTNAFKYLGRIADGGHEDMGALAAKELCKRENIPARLGSFPPEVTRFVQILEEAGILKPTK